MNLGKIPEASGSESYAFYKDVTKHLAKVFGNAITREDAEVLGHILHVYEIRFADGFIVNGDDSATMMGRSDAAIVLAAVCDEVDRDWEWWRSQITPSGLPQPEFNERLTRLLGHLLVSESVKAIVK